MKLSLCVVALFLTACSHTPKISENPLSHSWVEINVNAFEKNIRTLQTLTGNKTSICAVMKSDGYEHGLSNLMPSLIQAKIPCLAVTNNSEAKTIRDAGFTGQLIRIRTATPAEMEAAQAWDMEEMVGSLAQAKSFSSLFEKAGRTIRYHLALNSLGMSRNGLELSTERGKVEALELIKVPHLKMVGMMAHFPVEDPKDIKRVLKTFQEQSAWVIANGKLDRKQITLHCANSFATLNVPESWMDMVRTGGLLFGDVLPNHNEYEKVMALKSTVAAVNPYPAGNTVNYDRTFKLKRDSRLANIPVGYSDGYGRVFSNRGSVLIRGHRVPVVGRVTMNTIMADVTDHKDIQPGDEVVLFGKQGKEEITQQEVEKKSGTVFAELYTLWGVSNPRKVVNLP